MEGSARALECRFIFYHSDGRNLAIFLGCISRELSPWYKLSRRTVRVLTGTCSDMSHSSRSMGIRLVRKEAVVFHSFNATKDIRRDVA